MDPVLTMLVILFALAVWGIPIIFVASDPSISKKEKAIWVFAIGFASWFAWLLYHYVAPVLPKPKVYDFGNQKHRGQVPPTL